jgi:3-mercaptopyruvate sulfurtransferase SseA
MSKRRSGKVNTRRPLVLIALGAVFMLGALLFWSLSDEPQTASAPQPPASAAEVERVSPDAARAALDQNRAVFLDVRTREEYQQSHIPGAVSIPLDELPTRLSELSAQDWIITYCT